MKQVINNDELSETVTLDEVHSDKYYVIQYQKRDYISTWETGRFIFRPVNGKAGTGLTGYHTVFRDLIADASARHSVYEFDTLEEVIEFVNK